MPDKETLTSIRDAAEKCGFEYARAALSMEKSKNGDGRLEELYSDLMYVVSMNHYIAATVDELLMEND